VFCTPGTQDLAQLVLVDSAHIQEEDARAANQGHYSKHDPAEPLYTVTDAWRALSMLQPVGFDRPMPVVSGVEISFVPMGHLLGSAAVRMRFTDDDRTVVFGGDLGRYGRPVLQDPQPIAEADVLLCESTYGDRLHEPDDGGARLATIVNETHARGGKLVIPAFAIGRVEEVLYWLRRLEGEKRIPVQPVYLDSPMAIEALKFYARRGDELDTSIQGNRNTTVAFQTQNFRPRQLDEASHRRRVEWHGYRRSCAAAPGPRAARSSAYGVVRRVPSCRDQGPFPCGRRTPGEAARPRGGCCRTHREDRLDVGTR
jgi:Cft2 family RNA processing exonuclease